MRIFFLFDTQVFCFVHIMVLKERWIAPEKFDYFSSEGEVQTANLLSRVDNNI